MFTSRHKTIKNDNPRIILGKISEQAQPGFNLISRYRHAINFAWLIFNSLLNIDGLRKTFTRKPINQNRKSFKSNDPNFITHSFLFFMFLNLMKIDKCKKICLNNKSPVNLLKHFESFLFGWGFNLIISAYKFQFNLSKSKKFVFNFA